MGKPVSFLVADFSLRLPCGDAEKSRKGIRDFLVIRKLNLKMRNRKDEFLPLAQPPSSVNLSDVLDLRMTFFFFSFLQGFKLRIFFFLFFFFAQRKYGHGYLHCN